MNSAEMLFLFFLLFIWSPNHQDVLPEITEVEKNIVMALVIQHRSYFWLISGSKISSATTRTMMKGHREVSVHLGLPAASRHCNEADIRLEVIIQHNRKVPSVFQYQQPMGFLQMKYQITSRSCVRWKIKIQSSNHALSRWLFHYFHCEGQQGERSRWDGWQSIQG